MSAGTQKLVAGLAAAFPARTFGADNLRMYVRALGDIPDDELARAVSAFIADGQWFPTVRELRRAVVETRLGLPSAEEAWERAQHLAMLPVGFSPCDACGAVGYLGGNRDQDELCPDCGGNGEVETARSAALAAMTEPERAAFAFIGRRSIADTDSPEVVRAQYAKAYQRARDTAVRLTSLDSAGMAELAPALREIEAAR